MYAQKEKPKENKSRAVANSEVQKKSSVKQGFGFVDNRPRRGILNLGSPYGAVQRYPSIVQLVSNDDLIQARNASMGVESLTIQEVITWQQRIRGWISEVGLYDPRLPQLERLYHVFSRQELAREHNRPHLMTRILSPEQLERRNIGINSVRRSARSLNRNLNGRLRPRGRGTTDVTRLYSFMRRFGGAGMQGFHHDPMRRLNVIYNILNRMVAHRETNSGRGPKFAMVAVDRRQLSQENIFDTSNPRVRDLFLTAYQRFHKMYQEHSDEGVVAVKGDIDSTAIKGLRAFRGVPSKKLLKKIMELLLDLASAEPEPTFNKFSRRDDEDDPSGSGGLGFGRTGMVK